MTDLRVGAAILREALQTVGKEEDEGLKVRTAKAEEEIRVKRVCSPYREGHRLWDSVVVLGKGSVPRGSQGANAPHRTGKKAAVSRGERASAFANAGVLNRCQSLKIPSFLVGVCGH
jgi:hypothetical protein